MGEQPETDIAVRSADNIARGNFSRIKITPEEESEAVGIITSKISQCLQDDCMDKLAESVRKADAKEKEHRLFFDMLEEVSEKLKGVEKIVRDIVQEVSGQGGEDQGDRSELELIISKAMTAFARLGIGYKAERTEKAFGLHNGEYFKTVLARRVADVFKERQDNDEKILNRLGVIFIDLNGLKNINELSLGKYSAGDKGLKILADILGSNELNSWAKGLGIKLTPAHYHGDEFLLMVDAVDNKEVDLVSNKNTFKGVNGRDVTGISIMKYIGEYIGEALKSKNTDNIFNFTDQEQLKKVKPFINSLPPELKKEFNEDFKYQLTCSYGYATLRDAIPKIIKEKETKELENMNSQELVLLISGFGLIDTAAKKLGIAKGMDKLVREKGSAKDQILERFYRFVRERQGSSISIEDVKEIIKVLFEFRDEVLNLRKKLSEEKRKRIRASRKVKSLEIQSEEMPKHNMAWTKNNVEKPLLEEIARLQEKNLKNRSVLGRLKEWFEALTKK